MTPDQYITECLDSLSAIGHISLSNGPYHRTEPVDDFGELEATLAQYPNLKSDPFLFEFFRQYASVSIDTLDVCIQISTFAALQVAAVSPYDLTSFDRFFVASITLKMNLGRVEPLTGTYVYPKGKDRIDRFSVVRTVNNEEKVVWDGSTFADWVDRLVETKGLFLTPDTM